MKALSDVVDVGQAHVQNFGRGVVLGVLDPAAAGSVADADEIGTSVDDVNFLEFSVRRSASRGDLCRQVF
jgi:hypothetical protein